MPRIDYHFDPEKLRQLWDKFNQDPFYADQVKPDLWIAGWVNPENNEQLSLMHYRTENFSFYGSSFDIIPEDVQGLVKKILEEVGIIDLIIKK